MPNVINYLLLIYLLYFICSLSTASKCDLHTTIIREIESDGFHKELKSLVEVVSGRSVTKWQDCYLAVEEILPSSVYVDPDQLSDLASFRKTSACADTAVDVEAPEDRSPELAVHVYSQLNSTENLLSASLNLPIHLRYHKPRHGGGYKGIKIGLPRLYLRCARRLDCPNYTKAVFPCYRCSRELCTWIEFPFKTNAETLTFSVPVGDLNHAHLVKVLTLLVTSGGCVYILSILASKLSQL